MATWDDVRKLALALPEAEESTTYRKPAFKVAGKNFAWESPHVRGALALNCDAGELPLMIEARPEMFFTTPHYDGYPIVLVRLKTADAGRAGRADRGVVAHRRAEEPRRRVRPEELGGDGFARQAPRDDLRDPVGAHRHAVEDVRGLHRLLLVRDDDELRPLRVAAE